MTSLAAVLSVDSRGPSGLYLMTDSRITWKGYDGEWDAGQKTYFASNQAHIFGFCGNAAFPPSVTCQLIEQIEAGIIGSSDNPDVVRADVLAAIKWAHSVATNKFFDGFSLFHGHRERSGMRCKFHLWRYQYYMSTDKIYDDRIELDATTSCLAHIDGSGKSTIQHFRDTIARGGREYQQGSCLDLLRRAPVRQRSRNRGSATTRGLVARGTGTEVRCDLARREVRHWHQAPE